MAGYSGTPLPKKLGIKDDHRVALLGAPAGMEEALLPLPAGARLVQRVRSSAKSGGGGLDVILFFTTRRAELEKKIGGLKANMAQNGGLWICWPKRAANVETDMTENVARELGLGAGLVDNKVCAVDDIWSGLRLVIRLRDRK